MINGGRPRWRDESTATIVVMDERRTDMKLSIDGCDLYYEYHRNDRADRTVVMIHGWAGSLRDMDRTISPLLPEFNVLCFDHPGHGRSSRLGRYSLSEYIRYTRALIAALEIDRPILIGLSMGTIVASELFREDPGAFERVILISPPLAKISPFGVFLLPSLILLQAVGILAPTFDMLRRRRKFQEPWCDLLISADGDFAEEARAVTVDAMQRVDPQAIVQGIIDIVTNKMILSPPSDKSRFHVIVGAEDQFAGHAAVHALFEPSHIFEVPNELHGVSRTSFSVVNPIIADILA